jgi:hypothetical protein
VPPLQTWWEEERPRSPQLSRPRPVDLAECSGGEWASGQLLYPFRPTYVEKSKRRIGRDAGRTNVRLLAVVGRCSQQIQETHARIVIDGWRVNSLKLDGVNAKYTAKAIVCVHTIFFTYVNKLNNLRKET